MSTQLAIGIDFGCKNTKVAWRDEQGVVRLLKFGDLEYLLSLFYLPEDSDEILLGEDAQHAYEDEPLGVVEALKRLIERGKLIYTSESRSTDPQPLLETLFRYIKQHALQTIPDFQGLSPEHIVITVPGNAPEGLELTLRRAASAVAWDHPQFMAEPLAAARYWLHGEGNDAEDTVVVVLDSGGGTTDWACLQRTGQRIHRAEQYPPHAISVGGTDVDCRLSEWVLERHPALAALWPEPRLRDRLRAWKEAVFNGENPPPVRIKGKVVEGLNEAVLRQIYQQALLDKVLPAFAAFLKPIADQHPEVPVLLVGGSTTDMLEQAVSAIHPHVRRSQELVSAVIRGALVTAERESKVSLEEEKSQATIEAKPVLPIVEDVILPITNNKELIVGKNGAVHFHTISEAIRHVADGGIIKIMAGDYQESLIIKKSVTLIGEETSRVRIRNIGSRVIEITNATLVINHLTIHGINVGNNLPKDSDEAQQFCIVGDQSVLYADHCRIISEGGGGIFLRGKSLTSKIYNCEVEVEDDIGCILHDFSRLFIESCKSKSYFFAVCCDSSYISIVNSNIAGSEGCILLQNRTSGSIENSELNGEKSVLNVMDTSSLRAIKTKFVGKSTDSGTIFLSDNSRFEANDCQILALGQSEKALNCNNSSYAELIGCDIESDDEGYSTGSGLNFDESTRFKIFNCRIKCRISVYEMAKGVVNGCFFLNKESSSYVSGIWVGGVTEPVIEECAFNGASVAFSDDSKPKISNCKFIGNSSGSIISCGISIFENSQAQVENCEVSGYKKSGIDINDGAKPKIKGCKITQNGNGIVAKDYSSPIIENCDLRGNIGLNIDNDTSGKVRSLGNQV